MANRTDKVPPGSCRMPKKLWMKRKKINGVPNLVRLKVGRVGCDGVKMATGGSPFAPLRIPPVNQPKI